MVCSEFRGEQRASWLCEVTSQRCDVGLLMQVFSLSE